jgi:REP element-mobilizing transposase RayT
MGVFKFGKATTTDTRVSVAGSTHDHRQRLEAKESLKYPPVLFSGIQARSVGEGFKTSIEKGKVTVWACSIMPDHVHMVIGRHRCDIETIVNLLKGEATKRLLADGLHPLAQHASTEGEVPRCFAKKFWKVYLDSVEGIDRSVVYVDGNPEKEGKPRQRWRFVTPYHRDV